MPNAQLSPALIAKAKASAARFFFCNIDDDADGARCFDAINDAEDIFAIASELTGRPIWAPFSELDYVEGIFEDMDNLYQQFVDMAVATMAGGA